MFDPTLLVKPLHAQSIFFQEKTDNLMSVNVTVFSEIYTISRAKRRKPFVISRQPSKSHLPPTGLMNCFGLDAPWHCCFAIKAS